MAPFYGQGTEFDALVRQIHLTGEDIGWVVADAGVI
jgi:hypothetical protein